MLDSFVVRCLAIVAVLLTSTTAMAAPFVEPPREEEWARLIVDKEMLAINYRIVAKGQDVSFKIRLTNTRKVDIQVTGLATSCGCLSWDENRGGILPAPMVISPGQEKFVTLRLDTIRHQGEKKGTKGIITFFDPSIGQFGTATILAEGYIRSDVVLQPGSVNFGSVEPKKGAEQRVAVSYAGRVDWRLISAKCNSIHLDTEIIEKSRVNNGPASTVNYELIVHLKDTAPVGILHDQMILVTDDANNPQLPVQVEARIEPEIVITDANFGSVFPGKPKDIQVLVRYTKLPIKPFKIEKFERTKAEETIKVKKSDEMRPLHQLTLTFTPPNEPGPFEEDFYLTISGRPDPIVFKARGRIMGPLPEPGLK